MTKFKAELKIRILNHREEDRLLRYLALAGEMGFAIAIPIAGGALLGNSLDKKFGSSPKLTLILLLTGLIVGFFYLLKIFEKEK